ncbi:MAG: peptidylprolyl isomerase [candidate division Zixibacteria bacterium]|nr:peptidylprolyl isomerase [candidate division Zixibacteria bacterium]
MKTIAMTLMLSLLIMIGQAGCSSKQEAGDTAVKKTESAKMTVEQKGWYEAEGGRDSLETKRHPIRDENNQFVTIVTDFGSMTLELYRDVAPAHADSFMARTVDGFYDSLLFFRIIDNFMIQGGDPNNNGSGNAGYFLQAEFSKLPHKDGTLSMARAAAPNSASCQFYICLGRARTKGLDRQYTVFGQLLKGYDVLHKIGSVEVKPNPRGERSMPKEPVCMTEVYLSDPVGNRIGE